jgi:uncharacterized protein (TIGR02271 family)
MAELGEVGQVTVLDSEGVRGTAPAHALHEPGAQVLITFNQGQRVQAPVDMLRRRDDGSYFLPLSLRELHEGTVALDNAGDGHIVAVIPVVVEEAHVAKRQVETGRVRIQKTVQSADEWIDVPLLRDRVQVERVPVERYLEQPETVHYQGDTLVIPVMEEVVVVQKRLLLREEIHVTTLRQRVQHREAVQLQREQVTVTRHPPGPDGPAAQA